MHYAIVIKENSKEDFHIRSNLACFLRPWLIWTLPLGRLGFCFNVIAINPRFITCYDAFDQVWILIDCSQRFLRDVFAVKFLLKIQQFWNKFGCYSSQAQSIFK